MVGEVEKIFNDYGVKIQSKDEAKVKLLKKNALQNGINFLYSRQTHIGSDKLSSLMIRVRDDLKKRGLLIYLGGLSWVLIQRGIL